MPAEEMDIITDVSHSGPAEDIDLDLDDAVAHTDDDMELGDYNEQQVATEAADETMAEGDDTSDGMVDADEIDYNVSGVANSDYDIDIGGTDGNPYEMDNLGQNVDISLGDEIEYAADTEPTGLANEQITNDDGWLQDQSLAEVVTAEGNVAQMEDTPIEEGDEAPVSQDVQAATIIADSAEAAVPSDATHAEVHRNEALKDEQQRNEPAQGGHVELENSGADFGNEAFHLVPAETGSGESSKDQFTDQNNKNTSSTLPAESDNQTENSVTLTSASIAGVELAGSDNLEGAAGAVTVANNAEVSNFSETTETLEASWVEPEGTAEAGEHCSAAESSEISKIGEVSEVHASGDAEARVEPTHDTPDENEKPYGYGTEDTHSRENPSGDHSNPVVGTVEEDVDADADADNHSQSSRLQHTQITASEHPSAIAARYEILMHYGSTDYQLFAKSVDDDPEQYFLSDRSALDTSLLEFLASIRDVISQEVSPLDELVMHIDGLGLEFGETTTRDFIERYTFGDMLALYDKLIKNEDADDTPELYVYLLVRPNCSQRLAALVDQANSGRGFGDVAVYRDSTPAQDDEAPHGEGRVLAISPDVAVDEFFEDFDEEDSNQEQDAFEDRQQEAVENQEEDIEYQEQEVTEYHEQDAAEHHEQGTTEDHEQESTEYHEQGTTEDHEQEATGHHEQDAAEDYEQETTGYHEQEAANYEEQEPFEFEMQEGVEHHEHNEFDETTQRRDGSTDNQDYDGYSEQRAPADDRDTLESTPVATAPVEMAQALEQNADEPNRAEDVDLSNYDDNEDGLDAGPAQDDHTDVIGMDSTITEGEGAAAPDGQVADASSHNTSATATLNGDENDEIDYSDGEAEADAKPHETITSATLQEQADGDFIWESEDEDTREETVVTPPKQSAQVSPTTGKRARSGSDAAEDADTHASVRRRLS